MTTVNTSDVLAFAPEFSSLDNSIIQIYLDLAKNFVFENKWERKYLQAVCLLTAHFLVLQERGSGSAGPVTAQSVGELSISYGAVGDSKSELTSTTYGTIYLSLRKTLKITPLVV